jgi:hypothetical protein
MTHRVTGILDFFPSFGILGNRGHDVSETRSVSVFRWERKTPTQFGPLERANLNHIYIFMQYCSQEGYFRWYKVILKFIFCYKFERLICLIYIITYSFARTKTQRVVRCKRKHKTRSIPGTETALFRSDASARGIGTHAVKTITRWEMTPHLQILDPDLIWPPHHRKRISTRLLLSAISRPHNVQGCQSR